MLKKIKILTWRIILTLSLIAILTLFLPRLITQLYAAPRIFTVDKSPVEQVAIVFGAGLLRDGSAGPVLSDRACRKRT